MPQPLDQTSEATSTCLESIAHLRFETLEEAQQAIMDFLSPPDALKYRDNVRTSGLPLPKEYRIHEGQLIAVFGVNKAPKSEMLSGTPITSAEGNLFAFTPQALELIRDKNDYTYHHYASSRSAEHGQKDRDSYNNNFTAILHGNNVHESKAALRKMITKILEPPGTESYPLTVLSANKEDNKAAFVTLKQPAPLDF